MKRKIGIALLAIFLMCGLQTSVFAESTDEKQITPTLRLLSYETADLNGRGSVTFSGSAIYNKPYKYITVTKTVTLTNTSNTTMNAQLYLPFLYTYGLSETDNTSYDYIGYPSKWDSSVNKFFYNGYVTNGGYVGAVVGDEVTLSYPLRKDLKDAQYFINDIVYKQADLADWRPDIPIVRELAQEGEDETIIAFDMGELAPGETRTFSFDFKNYGIPTYAGVSGIDVVTYLRTEYIAKPVTVQYHDENGDAIIAADVINENGEQLLDEPYTTTPKEISGYRLVATPENAKGILSEEEQTVVYRYQKITDGNVIVNYLDESGNALTDATILTGEVGSNYQTEAKAINGWELKNTVGNASGTYNVTDQTVNYIYQPIAIVDSLPNTGENHDAYIAIGLGIVFVAGTMLTILKIKRK
ncbi:MucBP domain-containing protein [Culicoidibacter larvae]|uniref:LPXTG cell wall anchor domain-containing protein n=1 Tax=Culicoidibacter larvae TaxID=2579976 RepID=A0A5R8QD82_9FIRM|nr:MucBP domain-containing protein [Culicoidibacter larvae]TLG74226.1 LPXTG cell wall anchor domain-containing protein [Culicoidibacter larvae]